MNNKKSIAVFVPHLGCPCACSFCNQRAIAGKTVMPDKDTITGAVETALLHSSPGELEIAFFGGSFTMIGEDRMRYYLETAAELVLRHGLYGIRFSTRPDGINPGIIKLIKRYPVTAVELGAQSMDDRVLAACGRGHTSADTIAAASLIKESGLELVIQFMTGLPESGEEDVMKTAESAAGLKPDAVRIYPLLVLEGTSVYKDYLAGRYTPQTLSQAVSLCVRLLKFFRKKGIPVIKLGLQHEEGFEPGGALKAGPYHPAFRELCEGEIYYEELARIIKDKDEATVLCNPRELSKVKGHGRANEARLKSEFPQKKILIKADRGVAPGDLKAI